MGRLAAVPAGSEVDPCCCDSCCLYPWPDPDGLDGGPHYPETDLPSPVTMPDASTISHNEFSPYTYGDLLSSDWYLAASFSTSPPEWLLDDLVNSRSYKSPCLFGEYEPLGDYPAVTLEDDFPDTLTVNLSLATGHYDESITVTRVSDCCWESDTVILSTDTPEDPTRTGVVRVCYNTYSTEENGAYAWAVAFVEEGVEPPVMGFKGRYDSINGFEPDSNVKQNTPLTTEGITDEVYGNTGDTIFAYVS